MCGRGGRSLCSHPPVTGAGQRCCSPLQSAGRAGAPCPGDVRQDPTLHLGDEAQAAFEVGADGVQAPAELGVAAVLVGPTGVIANIQLVTALGHGRDAQV